MRFLCMVDHYALFIPDSRAVDPGFLDYQTFVLVAYSHPFRLVPVKLHADVACSGEVPGYLIFYHPFLSVANIFFFKN